MSKFLIVIFLVLLLAAASCGLEEGDVASTTMWGDDISTKTGESLNVTEISVSKATETLQKIELPQPSPTIQVTSSTHTPLGGGGTVQTLEPEIEPVVCPPLEGHTSAELPEIVAAPYAPPPPGKEERHHGVDFSYYQRGERTSIEGVGISAVFGGRVVTAVQDSFPYGSFVIVETPSQDLPLELREQLDLDDTQSLYLLYAHMLEEPRVSPGDRIPACEILGSVGESGNSDIPHLHLEARIGPAGAVITGMAYYHTQTTEEERANYEMWRTGGDFNHFDPMIIFQLEMGE